MTTESDYFYPNCSSIRKQIQLGDMTKLTLLEKLLEHNIHMNELAEALFADARFSISDTPHTLETVELFVFNLGFPDGATLPELFKRADELGLKLCPLEVGPILRLIDMDQEEGAIGGQLTQNKAPHGSITVASPVIETDDSVPKGFYLRKMDGVLWLRGYTCADLHIFSPEDKFVFCL